MVDKYIDSLEIDAWLTKSQAQQNMSEKPIRLAQKYFQQICGDLPIASVERHHGVKFNDFFADV